MKTNNIGVFIMVKHKDQQDHRSEVVESIKHMAGIYRACQNPIIKGLVDVNYDPTNVSTHHIISTIKGLGCESALVGM